MKTATYLLIALTIFILIFVWYSSNYISHLTGPEYYFPETASQRNFDLYGIPIVISAFIIIGIIPALSFLLVKRLRFRLILVPLSGVSIIFIFWLILGFIFSSNRF